MNRRILYILIVVVVLVLAVVLLGPKIFGKSPAATAATTTKSSKRGATSDTGALASKATKAKGKARAAKGKGAKEAEVVSKAPEAVQPAAVKDTTPLNWVGDPFVRDWLMAGELRDMRLRAVTIGAKSLALINDRVVAKGDTINGKRVAEITRDSVVFEFGGQRRGLKIGE